MHKKNSLILLATYNGGKYIKESLDSFPTETDIFISDDCSQDDTVSVINQYREKNITLCTGKRHGSATSNFRFLINNCSNKYEYYFLADQDDCWTNDKYSVLIEEMKNLEKLYGPEIPILIYGDSLVVDKNLDLIDESFFKYDGIDPYLISRNGLNIFFQNIGQGATMIFNRALLEQVRIIPENIYMHDWWLMLFAQTFGVLHLSDKKTLLYRQHGDNSIGATKRNLLQQIYSQIKQKSKIKEHLKNVINQTEQFYIEYHGNISDKQISNFLTSFLDVIRKKNFFIRKIFLLRHKIYLSSLKRTLVLYLYF